MYDIDVEAALRRRSNRDGEDRLELKGVAFQEKVASGFRALIAEEPERVKRIDAAQGIDQVFLQTIGQARLSGLEISEQAQVQALSELVRV